MTSIDWTAIAEKLFIDTRMAIERFGERYPGELCCHVQYDCDPGNGYMSLGFDTPAASVDVARQNQEEGLPFTREILGTATWQRDAHSFLKQRSLPPANYGLDSLAHALEVFWEFPEWSDFATSPHYPEQVKEGGYIGDDYLQAAVALCIWHVVERLEAENVFARLPMASPCIVSYCHHDDDMVILRVLNWPRV